MPSSAANEGAVKKGGDEKTQLDKQNREKITINNVREGDPLNGIPKMERI